MFHYGQLKVILPRSATPEIWVIAQCPRYWHIYSNTTGQLILNYLIKFNSGKDSSFDIHLNLDEINTYKC